MKKCIFCEAEHRLNGDFCADCLILAEFIPADAFERLMTIVDMRVRSIVRQAQWAHEDSHHREDT